MIYKLKNGLEKDIIMIAINNIVEVTRYGRDYQSSIKKRVKV